MCNKVMKFVKRYCSLLWTDGMIPGDDLVIFYYLIKLLFHIKMMHLVHLGHLIPTNLVFTHPGMKLTTLWFRALSGPLMKCESNPILLFLYLVCHLHINTVIPHWYNTWSPISITDHIGTVSKVKFMWCVLEKNHPKKCFFDTQRSDVTAGHVRFVGYTERGALDSR